MNITGITVFNNQVLESYLQTIEMPHKWAQIFRKRETALDQRNTVGCLIKSTPGSRSRKLLLGVFDDGMPLFFNFLQQELAPLLINCDAGCGKTHQLQVIADSAMQQQQKDMTSFYVFSLNPAEWCDLQQRAPKNNAEIHAVSWNDPAAIRMIEGLTSTAEKRFEDPKKAADIYLFLDDLPGLLQLDIEAQVNLRWLLSYGPQVQIWPVAALETVKQDDLMFWTNCFKSIIQGCSEWPSYGSLNDTVACMISSALEPGEFSLCLGKRWLKYRLPMLGS